MVFTIIFPYYFLKHFPQVGKKSELREYEVYKTRLQPKKKQSIDFIEKKLTSIGLYDLDGKKVKIYNETKALFLFWMFLIHIDDFSFFVTSIGNAYFYLPEQILNGHWC